MTQRALLIVHQEHSNPGLVGQMLHARGYTLDIRCPAIGHALPDRLDDHAAVVVFGGPMSANDDDTLPFIRTELDWIPNVLDQQLPFLGICLGAQLLARSLGARVAPHEDGLREIGYFPIQPTEAGQQYFKKPMHVYHWHQEGFELADGASLLAGGEWFPNQAYRYGENAYGVQFHPEITAPLIDKWTTQAADHLTLAGAQPRDAHFEGHARYAEQMEQWLSDFMEHWLSRDRPSQAQEASVSRSQPTAS